MNNFEFYNPTKLIFGKGQIQKLKEYLPKKAKILLIYGGGSIKKNGVYDAVKQNLSEHNFVEFGGIEPNPQFDTLMKAVSIVRTEKIDFILAVGGGSVIDGTKFIAAAANYKKDPWDILEKRVSIQRAIPFGTILTLPATGSEMNSFAVISKGDEKLSFGHPLIYPKFSILDPEITFSLSERQLSNGIVDAFVHTTEQYLTNNINTPIQDRFAEGILLTLIEETYKIMNLNKDYESRANLMLSATMALNGLIGIGVNQDWATHQIGHELTALYGIDHARSLAIILPSLLRIQKETKKDKLIQFASRVWKIPMNNPNAMIEKAIQMTEDFFESLGVATKLRLYKIPKQDFPKITDAISKHFSGSLGENQDLNESKILQILEAAY
jgi:NADP-dependent alcohol dehydrogenase